MVTKPKIIVFDVDGVLTDGKFTIDSHGDRSKSFHTRDVRALKELVARGYEVYLITASSWSGLESFAEKTGTIIKVLRDKSEFNPSESFICVVDDSWDFALIEKAVKAFCPADAYWAVKAAHKTEQLQSKGGEGVACEVLDILKLEQTKETYSKENLIC
jgi:3-deoxy-D-manno-octulosonate 8-phosphate phosphatase (KDO 8-P phosphatase)